jgi:hypothetical protein
VRIFVTRWMARFARKNRIDDDLLVEAIGRADKGLIDADLGGGVIKQRVGRPGQGRSGGYRTLIAFRSGDRAIFIFAFAKNERENIEADELHAIKDFAADFLRKTDAQLSEALRESLVEEIKIGNDT